MSTETLDILHNLPEQEQRIIGANFAESVLRIFQEKYPNDDRPHKAIEAARAFARGEIEKDVLISAQDSAWESARYATQYEVGTSYSVAADAPIKVWAAAWFPAHAAAADASWAAAWAAAEYNAEDDFGVEWASASAAKLTWLNSLFDGAAKTA